MSSINGNLQPKTSSADVIEEKRSSVGKILSSKTTKVTPDIDKSSKRWSILGKVNSMSTTATGPGHQRSHSSSPPKDPYKQSAKALEAARQATAASRGRPSLTAHHRSNSSTDYSSSAPSSPSFRAFSFKFSLEWNVMPQTHPSFHQKLSSGTRARSTENGGYGWERRLSPPRLPAPAHSWLVSQVPGTANEVLAREPRIDGFAQTKYAGRALAEWALVVMECNNFVQRRMSEGVPSWKHVEVPVMGVDGLKKFN